MFGQSVYTVNETTGFVTVCVEATGAELARDVNVNIFTASDSAIGKFVFAISMGYWGVSRIDDFSTKKRPNSLRWTIR